ncbi:amidohydrolase family protein [Kitasatospora sp. NPDC004669]|uniref:amidohydrolase family protein n=1 Tax=Kitasatospora sp. NPDC004669 TaxID=3154555 RepID=UPI0033A6A8C6
MARTSPHPTPTTKAGEPDGTPAGTLQEGATSLVARLVPATTTAQRLDGLLRAALARYHRLAGRAARRLQRPAGPLRRLPGRRPLRRADRPGDRRALVGARPGAEQIPELVGHRTELSHGRFRAGSVKIMQDGIAENFTAAMTSPYLDGCGCATANSGLSFVDPTALRGYVTELDALGFQVHFHALGDRAVREALDAVEAARPAALFAVAEPTRARRRSAFGARARAGSPARAQPSAANRAPAASRSRSRAYG